MDQGSTEGPHAVAAQRCEWCEGLGQTPFGLPCRHCDAVEKEARDAVWVMREMDSGQWKLVRSNPGPDVTEAFARQHAWFVQRELGPFTGKSGARAWHGATARQALMAARKDLFGEDVGDEPVDIPYRVEPEYLDAEFVSGHVEDDPSGKFWAGIHVGHWKNRIMVWGNTEKDAESLRDKLLQALRNYFPGEGESNE